MKTRIGAFSKPGDAAFAELIGGEQTKASDAAFAKPPGGRLWQLDAARGVAMILMALFHFLVDLRDFSGIVSINYGAPPVSAIGRTSAVMFIFLAGASCRFSRNNARRGLRTLMGGMVITAVTWAFPLTRELYVRFGILHFLGCAMLLTAFLQKLKAGAPAWLAASAISAAAGSFFGKLIVSTPLLIPFGIRYSNFFTYDYYPLFPWLCIFFAGVATGDPLMRGTALRTRLEAVRRPAVFGALTALGRRSFIFYFAHQPFLLAIAYVVYLF